ncbi:hypothetical protein CBOM_00290 [Ceraceosorus bombacis]|uniref:NEL domain-containing protein n=1 Tax=Ceraceosorus bombacis TaxID=401625 RepID=A0A0P1B904_9BASI|nr:hypothetical protein CBOM_00290 [Ceraceosorus bombacis]
MDRSPELRQKCCELISEALQSCGDRVILVMNQLELAVRVHEAEQGSMGAEALRELGLGMMKLDVVHEHARRTARTRTCVDEREVFLVYETRLRKSLRLPVSTQGMLYGDEVTEQDLQRAASEAIAAASDPIRQAAFLASWAPWQAHERRLAVASVSYESLPEQDIRFPQRKEPGSAWHLYEAENFLTW